MKLLFENFVFDSSGNTQCDCFLQHTATHLRCLMMSLQHSLDTLRHIDLEGNLCDMCVILTYFSTTWGHLIYTLGT